MTQFPSSHLLTLTGSPRQRGRVHGETLRREIHELLERWKDYLAWANASSPDRYIHKLISQTNFIPAIEKWTPGLLEEVRGIAEGAGAAYNDIFAFQLQDEEWWFGKECKQLQQKAANHCSSFGWQGNGSHPNLVAQNMDLPDYMQGYQVVLRLQDDCLEHEVLVFSVAGLVALNGMNSSPLGIVCNNLSQLNHSRDGLPVAYVLRGVLERNTFEQARSFLSTIPHASGQNYLLGSPTQILDLECSANQVVMYFPNAHSRGICHTNHPFANRDYHSSLLSPATSPQEIQAQVEAKAVNSRTRHQNLCLHLGAVGWLSIDPEAARRLLSSHGSPEHPVCRHPGTDEKWSTLGTSIMQFDTPSHLFVCPGPPCTSKFSEFTL